uniref:26S proteasome non-ATPase regulatory subunit 9 n=1 Tax=Lepeophtheirus salmonis TaxID=72036 RepID=D3PGL1_LEPSM|nr:26S proteasome non-ATPase regulatory subunit 9 [Lepeophtheirus salmonis]
MGADSEFHGDEMSIRAQVKEWMEQKEVLETEIKAFSDVLRSQGVGMEDSLVDEEDFPRNDIGDLVQIRSARSKIRSLNNDVKSLSDRIHKGIEEIHRIARETQQLGPFSDEVNHVTEVIDQKEAFAHVSQVAKGSPADAAGLKDGDLILKLGTLNKNKFNDLSQIGEIVKNSVGSSIELKVLRGTSVKRLDLTPKQWTGKGILGCLVKNYDHELDR